MCRLQRKLRLKKQPEDTPEKAKLKDIAEELELEMQDILKFVTDLLEEKDR